MKAHAIAGLAAFCIISSLHAGPVEDAIVATMRLSDRANYSWVATVDDDAWTYEIVGKTSQAGYSLVRMPIINSVRRRLGRGSTDNVADLIFRGNVKCVISTTEGWMTVDELPMAVDPEPILGTTANGIPIVNGGAMGRGMGKKTGTIPKVDDEREHRGYSNLQLGISPPHEELGVIVTSGTDLKPEGEMLSGNLTELGAQLLLVRDGQTEISPLRAAGSFILWFRGGMVARYQVRLEGVLAVKTPFGAKQLEVRQTTSTIIKDVGTTKFELPPEAKEKLGDKR